MFESPASYIHSSKPLQSYNFERSISIALNVVRYLLIPPEELNVMVSSLVCTFFEVGFSCISINRYAEAINRAELLPVVAEDDMHVGSAFTG